MRNKKKVTGNILHMCAKCSDLFSGELDTGESYQGYVPAFFPEEHCGDYIQFTIDMSTGMILNWKKPTKDQLAIFTKGR